MKRMLIALGLALVGVSCSAERAIAPELSKVEKQANIICPPGYTGMVIRTGNGEEEVCTLDQ